MLRSMHPIIPVIPDANRRGTAIAAIFLNEGPYLEEWVSFHLRLGVAHLYLYDNGSTDSSLEVLSKFDRSVVTVIPWRSGFLNINNQPAAYVHALANFGDRHRWMALIDIDEFLVPTSSYDIDAALKNYEDLPGIFMASVNFGFGGNDVRQDGYVTRNYLHRARIPFTSDADIHNSGGKSIVDPSRVSAVGIHWCQFDGNDSSVDGKTPGNDLVYNTDKALCMPSKHSSYKFDKLVLYHYFTKSREEFGKKIAGSICSPLRDEENKRVYREKRVRLAEKIESENVYDDSILRFWEPR